MLTVPGVEAITVAGFLAEVGDLNNYDYGQQIIRLAALNLKESSSGKRKGKTEISKGGITPTGTVVSRRNAHGGEE